MSPIMGGKAVEHLQKRAASHAKATTMAAIIKRLKASLSGPALEAALAAVRADSPKADMRLKPSVRKALKQLVTTFGPLVVTGRKSLKVYTLAGYESARKASSVTAKKHQPWVKANAASVAKASKARTEAGTAE
jgi:hypothetical protein